MKKLKMRFLTIAMILVLTVTTVAGAAGINYLPDVTKDMSQSAYWADEDEVIMTYEEIEALNAKTISTKGTAMYDLKNMAETVNGVSLNEALLKSTEADISYYLGWTYIESDAIAAKEDYREMLLNTQNPNATEKQNVLYGIAVHRTELRTFPSSKAIWDDPKDADLDYQYLAAVRVNEPLYITSVSADGKYYLAKSICCSGWVPAENVALCKDKAEWLSAWDISPDKALVVYGDKVYTDYSVTGKETSNLLLTMGTVLEQADIDDPNVLIDNRAAYQCYGVWLPVRNQDGFYERKLTLIPEGAEVSDGYLPLTKKNIMSVAFEYLGSTYGWGGGLLSDDCSGYIRNVYKCFGMELARNTSWQSAMPMAKVDMKYMCREERMAILDKMPAGSILFFSGHEMLYLGAENGKYYVISSVGSIMQPNDSSVRQRIRTTLINTLEVKRANGNSWLDELTVAMVPYWSVGSSDFPQYSWYHEGVAYFLKNNLMECDENKYFGTDKSVNFKDVCEILWNIEGKPSASEDSDTTALLWAVEAKITEASSDFESEITRELLAGVLYRYAEYKGADVSGTETDLSSFDDADSMTENLKPAVNYLAKKGVMFGKSETTLNPQDTVTKAELAVIIERLSKIK